MYMYMYICVNVYVSECVLVREGLYKICVLYVPVYVCSLGQVCAIMHLYVNAYS